MFGWLWRRSKGARGGDEGPGGGIPLDLAKTAGALEVVDGLPRPQWDVIRAACGAVPERYGIHRVWCEAQRQWLEALVEVLGAASETQAGYRIVETGSVLLLCARDADGAASLARMCEGTLATVRKILGESAGGADADAPGRRCGKLPVFVLDSQETYYTYIAYFYGDGEHGTSGGMCLREHGDDSVHIATVDLGGVGLERVLVHEMVHAVLDAGVPVWLQEGAAEVISRHVARDAPLLLDAAAVRKQRHHWAKHGLGAFWSGKSFGRADRGQEMSYALAEVLVRNLLSDFRAEFRDFLDEADAGDAGESAALTHLGISLGELVEQFLGEGDWAPAGGDDDDEEEQKDEDNDNGGLTRLGRGPCPGEFATS